MRYSGPAYRLMYCIWVTVLVLGLSAPLEQHGKPPSNHYIIYIIVSFIPISINGMNAWMSMVWTNDAPIVWYHSFVKSVYCPCNGINFKKVNLRLALVRLSRMPVLINEVMKMEVMIALVLSEWVSYPIVSIKTIFSVLITILIIDTKTVTKVVSPFPVI